MLGVVGHLAAVGLPHELAGDVGGFAVVLVLVLVFLVLLVLAVGLQKSCRAAGREGRGSVTVFLAAAAVRRRCRVWWVSWGAHGDGMDVDVYVEVWRNKKVVVA